MHSINQTVIAQNQGGLIYVHTLGVCFNVDKYEDVQHIVSQGRTYMGIILGYSSV